MIAKRRHTLKDKITIIIPCYNEKDYIGKLLQDISEQKHIDGVNVIIADNHSTDGTLEIIENCKVIYPNINIKVVEGGSVSEGRNNGSNYCDTPYIFFIDADVRFFDRKTLFRSWMTLTFFTGDVSIRLVTCKLKSYSKSVQSKLAYKLYNITHRLLIKKYPFAIGAYFCLSYEDFIHFGKFDVTTDNSEDFLFSQNFNTNEFLVLDDYIGQDDRRLKKMGYFGMAKHLVSNLYSYMRGDLNKFNKRTGYWVDK